MQRYGSSEFAKHLGSGPLLWVLGTIALIAVLVLAIRYMHDKEPRR